MSDQTNIIRIKGVYKALGELGDQVVFVGGATFLYMQTDRFLIQGQQTM